MERILYYNGNLIETEYNNSIIISIIELSLKKGDLFELFPFNYFGDEKTDYKEKRMEIHTKLKIADIKTTMIQTWNKRIRIKVEVFLESL